MDVRPSQVFSASQASQSTYALSAHDTSRVRAVVTGAHSSGLARDRAVARIGQLRAANRSIAMADRASVARLGERCYADSIAEMGFPNSYEFALAGEGRGRRALALRCDVAAASRADDRPDQPQHARTGTCR